MLRSCSRRALALLIALLALAATAPSALAASSPYGTNDAGGFRNVLPPGQNGTADFDQILAFRGPGLLPPHFADQQPLYENLLYASPTLSEDQIPSYFKDATFGVPRRRSGIGNRTAPRGDDRPRQSLRRPPCLRRDPRRHDVRRRLRGRRRPPLPDGRAAPHRPCRTRLLPRRRQRRRRRRASGSSPPTPKPTSNNSWRKRRSSTAPSGSRRSTTSAPMSKGSTPTSPPPTSIRN